MSDYKCPYCEYYIWEGKEIYECQLEQENLKLRSILQEIKAIAEADVHIVGDEKLYYDSIEQILDKINEVQND